MFSFKISILKGLKAAGVAILGALLASLLSDPVREAISQVPYVGGIVLLLFVAGVEALRNAVKKITEPLE